LELQPAITVHPFMGVPLRCESTNLAYGTFNSCVVGLYDTSQTVSNEYFMTMSVGEYVENGPCGIREPSMELVISIQADHNTRGITEVNLPHEVVKAIQIDIRESWDLQFIDD